MTERMEIIMEKEQTKWWQKAVIYQIYPRSFYDSNADGIGDLQGIIRKLPYLQELGIDAIWLSPVFRSPQDDNGYDISDYQDIDPIFGNLADMDELIAEGKKRGIRIIMDLVLNHSSDEHPWFLEAKKSRENPYHDFYVWRDGVEGEYPNDLKSAFCGPAWEWVPECGQYYLHQFSVKQPDLNWENPKLRQAVYDMINWWIDRGVGGFRLDVIDLIGKDTDNCVMAEGPMLHPFIREMSSHTFQRADLVTVGEAWSATPERAFLYSNPDGSELSMVFQFEHMDVDSDEKAGKWTTRKMDLRDLKKILTRWQKGLQDIAWNSLYWENHDQPRSVSRFGNDSDEYREISAKMLATCIHMMQGTPYVYQGEELGMTNCPFNTLENFRDLESINAFHELTEQGKMTEEEMMAAIGYKGRDNARTPMQWDDSANAGFSDASATPWIMVNPNYTKINAKDQISREDSVFKYYQKLIKLRHESDLIVYGTYDLILDDDKDIYAYIRTLGDEKLIVYCNFSENTREVELPEEFTDGKILISNYNDAKVSEKITLRPYEAIVIQK